MGTLFQSETMVKCQMFLQPDVAYRIVSELGNRGIVQFIDLAADVNASQKQFISEIRRCTELERKIKYIEDESKKEGIIIPYLKFIPKTPKPKKIVRMENVIGRVEKELLGTFDAYSIQKKKLLFLTELEQLLIKIKQYIHQTLIDQTMIFEEQYYSFGIIQPKPVDERDGLTSIAGLIETSRLPHFELMLWRVARGYAYLKCFEIKDVIVDPESGNPSQKTAFIIFSQGSKRIKSLIEKICKGFRVVLYTVPLNITEVEDKLVNVKNKIADLNTVLSKTHDIRQVIMVNSVRYLYFMKYSVMKMKAIYHQLNHCNISLTNDCLIAECWIPQRYVKKVKSILKDTQTSCNSLMPSFLSCIDASENPPTFIATNRFTSGFQNLIDAYGVPSYREINPGLYTIVTFPFLFAVMFGDLGHGLIILIFGAWMCIKEKSLGAVKTTNEIWNIFFAGRYIILLMGIFSMYTGFIYNDIFSKSIKSFGTSWNFDLYSEEMLNTNGFITMDPKYDYDDKSGPPFIGVDPIWQFADNKIIFLNSFKMKLSIILGFAQMALGLCLNVYNHRSFKRDYSIYLEFVPQMLFLVFLFGYMTFMMFYKWATYSAHAERLVQSPGCAPSILILFINMMLFSSTPAKRGCREFMFRGQDILQKLFVVLSLLCIPIMLFGKPLYIWINKRQRKANQQQNSQFDDKVEDAVVLGDDDEMAFGEMMIYQGIHTVEYVLSTVSHTASYLRLWALSLAHAELSEVIWSMVLAKSFKIGNAYIGGISVWIIFTFWVIFTISILVLMEGLSAFLHTLRLHWVEFMSKFYKGEGYLFRPFCFKTIINSEDEEC